MLCSVSSLCNLISLNVDFGQTVLKDFPNRGSSLVINRTRTSPRQSGTPGYTTGCYVTGCYVVAPCFVTPRLVPPSSLGRLPSGAYCTASSGLLGHSSRCIGVKSHLLSDRAILGDVVSSVDGVDSVEGKKWIRYVGVINSVQNRWIVFH